MPEQPELGLHRNRKYSIPTMGDGGPLNTFSRTNFLTGKSPCRYGSDQDPLVFTHDYDDSTNPDNAKMWPKLWPKAGRILNVPKCVIISNFITWPEFWGNGQVDFVHDVVNLDFVTGGLTNYYYLDQWDADKDWRGLIAPMDITNNDYRYANTILTVGNPYYARHLEFMGGMEIVRAELERGDDPIYVIYSEWIPSNQFERDRGHSVWTRHNWSIWNNDNAYWSGDEAMPNVLGGHTACDIFSSGGFRNRTHQDPNCPNWRSKSDDPPIVPCLLSRPPYFGTNVLHLWMGHFCVNWGGPGGTLFETYPLSPAGTQLGAILLSGYTGSALDFFDGQRSIWRSFGFDYGYTGPNGPSGVYDYHKPKIISAADGYKENFYKYRNMGLRFLPFPNEWEFAWQPDAIKRDQKWCPSSQFYFGFTAEEFSQKVATEDQYFIDYSSAHFGLKFGNIVSRIPDSPEIRDAINNIFPALRGRFEGYYNSIDSGTKTIYDKIIAENKLDDYNVACEEPSSCPRDAQGIIDYVRAYFKENP